MNSMNNNSLKNVKIDIRLSIASLAVATCGGLALFCKAQYLAYITIAVVDLYLFSVILSAAIKADEKHGTYQSTWGADWLFPSRRVGIFTIPLMTIALLLSFAGLYCGLPGDVNFKDNFSARLDSIYFSVVTLTTVGYGDFVPLTPLAKRLVVFEIGSGFLVLIGAFPLLISRISDFSEPVMPNKPINSDKR